MKHPVLKEVQKQNLETVGSPMVEPFGKNQSIRTFENKHWSTFLDRELGHKWKKLVEEVGLEFGSACFEAIYGATIILSGGDPLGTARIHNLLLVLCHISLSIKQPTLLKNKKEWWRLKMVQIQIKI